MNGEHNTPDNDEIDLRELVLKTIDIVKYFWKEQRFIWYALFLSVTIGMLISYVTIEEYTARTKILPYSNNGSSGGLSGLAGLAGVRLPVGPSEQIISVELYPEIISTLDFQIKLSETPIRFSKLKKYITPTEYFSNYIETSTFDFVKSYTIGLPGKLISSIAIMIGSTKETERFEFQTEDSPVNAVNQDDPGYISVVRSVGGRIKVKSDISSSILIIEGTMPDPVAAADLVQSASENLMKMVIEYEVRKIKEEVLFIEDQYARSEVRFRSSQENLALFTDRNRDTRSATSQIELQRLQSEYNLAFEIYRNFSTELEQARIELNKNTPIFTVLERPIVPVRASTPNIERTLKLSILFGLFFGVIFLLSRHFIRSLNLYT